MHAGKLATSCDLAVGLDFRPRSRSETSPSLGPDPEAGFIFTRGIARSPGAVARRFFLSAMGAVCVCVGPALTVDQGVDARFSPSQAPDPLHRSPRPARNWHASARSCRPSPGGLQPRASRPLLHGRVAAWSRRVGSRRRCSQAAVRPRVWASCVVGSWRHMPSAPPQLMRVPRDATPGRFPFVHRLASPRRRGAWSGCTAW